MGEITILGSVNGGNASKSFTQNPDGTFSDVGYNVGRSFVWRTVDIANVYDVADAVRGLSGSEFIVAGQVQHPLDRKGSRRKKYQPYRRHAVPAR